MPKEIAPDRASADDGAGARDLQKVLAALASPIRREILSLIWERDRPAPYRGDRGMLAAR